MASVNKVILDAAMLTQMYVVDKKSIPDIALATSRPRSSVRSALKSCGIILRSRADGIRCARWKLGKHSKGKKRIFSKTWIENMKAARMKHGELFSKGKRITQSGYIEFTRGEHKGRSEHVVAMESFIRRRIHKNEVVHHVDGNRQNNLLINLLLMTRSSHTKLHRKVKRNG